MPGGAPKGSTLCELIINLYSWHPKGNLNPANDWSRIKPPLRTEAALPHVGLHMRSLRPRFTVVPECGGLRHLIEGNADPT